jgi:S1-C subfamily serine protease
MRRLFVLILFPLMLCAVARSETPLDALRRNLVRISVNTQEPNYQVPWNAGPLGGGVGAGFVISGRRIMTNAHVISNARFISVERENDPKKYVAHVEFVAHDCDLAVLKLEDTDFFKETKPFEMGGLPAIESTVSVYGYPIGGERLSVTRGIVSRIDFQPYTHSGVDTHLAIQIDAAINPGNSGGPVLQDGKVVGVAFQGYNGGIAQNVGYMIPTPVIGRFLKDIEDGSYDRYVDLLVGTFNLQNPAMRRALGLADDNRGVMVSSVSAAGCASGILKVGDVLLEIDGHTIGSDSFVELDGERVEMPEVVERKFKGDEVKFHILRDRKESDVTMKLASPDIHMIQANAYDVKPCYVLFGGLLFQPLSRDFMEAWHVDDLRVRYFYDFFANDELFKERPEIVVLSTVLPDPINTYLADFRNGIVDEINGVKIRSLKDVADAFAKTTDYHVVKLLGEGRPVVFEAKSIDTARKRIHERYGVTEDVNLSEKQAAPENAE